MKLFKFRVKLENGTEFDYEEATDYPLIGTENKHPRGKDSDAFIENLSKIIKELRNDSN